MNAYRNLTENINKFLTEKYEEDDAGNKIFSNLQSILHFEKACIFYINEDKLTPIYTYNFSTDETDAINIKGLLQYSLNETLFVNNCPFAKLLITDDTPYTEEENNIFKTCSFITANIIKEIELKDIMKMQVKALQDGIVEINGFNKIIKEQNKKILEADKVKNKFLSNVSQELRSPLNSIIGFSDMLISEAFGNLNEKQKEYVKDIQIAGIHLLGMVNEILDISKIESHAVKMNYSTFDMNLCLTEVLNILKPLYLKKQIAINNRILPDTLIMADYQKLQQIFFNIVSNAIKFTSEGGKIEITAKSTKKYITVHIKDNGIGIASKHHKKIFKKFEQINPSSTEGMNSTGLGLTITKELVKMHNGTIKVESELTKGATFSIKLPIKSIVA